MKKKIILILLIILCVLLIGAGYIHLRPISHDAGGCGGGYVTYIFEKYNSELVEKYMDRYRNEKNIAHLSLSRETVTGDMDGRNIRLEVDVTYDLESGEKITERIGFVGKRYWIDSFKWSGPIEN